MHVNNLPKVVTWKRKAESRAREVHYATRPTDGPGYKCPDRSAIAVRYLRLGTIRYAPPSRLTDRDIDGQTAREIDNTPAVHSITHKTAQITQLKHGRQYMQLKRRQKRLTHERLKKVPKLDEYLGKNKVRS